MTTVYKRIYLEEKQQIEINEITLLSVDEFKANRYLISNIASWWWLRTPGINIDYPGVEQIINGWIFAGYVSHIEGIRPVLRIRNPKSFNLEIGDKFKLTDYIWTMLRDDLALCDDVIGKCAFRKDWKAIDANIYEKSDIKKWLENWAEENQILCKHNV